MPLSGMVPQLIAVRPWVKLGLRAYFYHPIHLNSIRVKACLSGFDPKSKMKSIYVSLQPKRHTITQYLRSLAVDKIALQSLIGWDWIQDVFGQLPT